MVKKIIGFLYNRYVHPRGRVKFKHGECFYCNGLIDALNPQFITIGDNFVSAPGSIITAHDASTFLFCGKYRIEKISIGDNVFLGANSVILPGVTIGDRVIIGAGAVVVSDVPSNSVFVGNPAKYVCSVDEYLEKCEKRDILYDVPDLWKKEFMNGVPHSEESLCALQNFTYAAFKAKNQGDLKDE